MGNFNYKLQTKAFSPTNDATPNRGNVVVIHSTSKKDLAEKIEGDNYENRLFPFGEGLSFNHDSDNSGFSFLPKIISGFAE
jgi:hypothetical protein